MELSSTGWTDNDRVFGRGKSDVELGYCEAIFFTASIVHILEQASDIKTILLT